MKPFINQHSIKTVNAELIKLNLTLVKVAGAYNLHTKQRGQPEGDFLRSFRNKETAFSYATDVMRKYWEVRADEQKAGNSKLSTKRRSD